MTTTTSTGMMTAACLHLLDIAMEREQPVHEPHDGWH
jgi:hypothetical protein